ncbi:MAG: hypothetical protein KF795_17705 [Labilithrix sp.]|nr:hypothetical protein [Labilithrix sp.]
MLVSTAGLTGGDDVDGGGSADAARSDGAALGDAGDGASATDAGALADAPESEGLVWAENGHRYAVRLYPSAVPWTTARDDAVSAGGHLVTITSAGEEAFVATVMSASPGAYVEAYGPWIGAYQPDRGDGGNEPAGGWVWVTGEPWSFTSWRDGEPNDSGGKEDYGHYFDSAWNDITLDGSDIVRSAVIEYE